MSNSVEKFKYSLMFGKIKRVPIIRETEKSIFIKSCLPGKKETREAKSSTYCQYVDTWEEARSLLVEKLEREVASFEYQLDEAHKRLQSARDLAEPCESADETSE